MSRQTVSNSPPPPPPVSPEIRCLSVSHPFGIYPPTSDLRKCQLGAQQAEELESLFREAGQAWHLLVSFWLIVCVCVCVCVCVRARACAHVATECVCACVCIQMYCSQHADTARRLQLSHVWSCRVRRLAASEQVYPYTECHSLFFTAPSLLCKLGRSSNITLVG